MEKCINCKYEWDHKGELRRITCPNCGKQWFRPITVSDEDFVSAVDFVTDKVMNEDDEEK